MLYRSIYGIHEVAYESFSGMIWFIETLPWIASYCDREGLLRRRHGGSRLPMGIRIDRHEKIFRQTDWFYAMSIMLNDGQIAAYGPISWFDIFNFSPYRASGRVMPELEGRGARLRSQRHNRPERFSDAGNAASAHATAAGRIRRVELGHATLGEDGMIELDEYNRWLVSIPSVNDLL